MDREFYEALFKSLQQVVKARHKVELLELTTRYTAVSASLAFRAEPESSLCQTDVQACISNFIAGYLCAKVSIYGCQFENTLTFPAHHNSIRQWASVEISRGA